MAVNLNFNFLIIMQNMINLVIKYFLSGYLSYLKKLFNNIVMKF